MFTLSEPYEWFPDTWWPQEGFAVHVHCWVVLDRVWRKNCVLDKLATFQKAMETRIQVQHLIFYEDREEHDRDSFLMTLQQKQRREAGDGLGVIDAMSPLNCAPVRELVQVFKTQPRNRTSRRDHVCHRIPFDVAVVIVELILDNPVLNPTRWMDVPNLLEAFQDLPS